MPLLQVRDIPEDLYRELARVAEQDHRSIAQETVILLKKALQYSETRVCRRKRVIDEIKKNSLEISGDFPDPAELVREDRQR
ncbi:MAG TPA: hypothetical protein ENN41_03110 [Sediminispirochaeta sp.]|nr:hypothetical protein [Sediminispirochaeta sp.]